MLIGSTVKYIAKGTTEPRVKFFSLKVAAMHYTTTTSYVLNPSYDQTNPIWQAVLNYFVGLRGVFTVSPFL